MDLDETTRRDRIVLALAGAILFVRLVGLMHTAFQTRGRGVFRQMQSWLTLLRCAWQVTLPTGDEHVEGLVRAKMQDWEVHRVRQVTKIIKMVATIISIQHLFNISMGLTRVNTISQDVLFYAFYLTALLLDSSPSLIYPGNIDWLYAAGTLLGCALVAPGVCPTEQLNLRLLEIKVVGFSIAISRLQVTIVAVSHGMCAVTACAHYLLANSSMLPGVDIETQIMVEIAWVLVVVATVWNLRQSVQTSIRNEFEAKTLRDEQSACKGLLRMVCDVVIELDSELQLVGPTQDLCTFLLRGSTRVTEGSPLADLMPLEEDKAKFHRHCTSQDGPHAIHVGVRDGNGTLIEVELFSFRFEGLDGLPRCLAGLREFGDSAPPAPQLPQELSLERPLGTVDPQIVVLDVTDSQLQIQRISAGLARLTGAGEGGKFVRYLQNSRAFNSWIQSQLAQFIADESIDTASFPVRLRPRTGSASWHFRASCTCVFNDDADYSDMAEHNVWVQIMIQDITRHRGSFRSTRIQSSTVGSDFDSSRSNSSPAPPPVRKMSI